VKKCIGQFFLGEQSNTIGYETGSSPLTKVYTTAKTSLVENFEHEIKNDMVANTFC
jgi:hypothetical protein